MRLYPINMPRRPNQRSRRQRNLQVSQLITLSASASSKANVPAIIDKARRGHVAINRSAAAEARTNHLAEASAKLKDDLTEIFFPCLRHINSAKELVNGLHATLYKMRLVSTDFSGHSLTDPIQHLHPPVIRCQVKPKNTKARFPGLCQSGHVIVRSRALADSIIKASPILIGNDKIEVVISNRLDKTSRRTIRDGLDCPSFPIGRLQLGHLSSNTLYLSSWNTHDNFHVFSSGSTQTLQGIDRMDAVLELNAIQRVVSITTNFTFNAYTAQENYSIERTISRLRIEVPFRSVYGWPLVQSHNGSSDLRVICIPISCTPLIFREQEVNLQVKFDEFVWDATANNAKPVNWVRTIDPTPNNAFSDASTIRFMVDEDKVRSIMGKFCAMGIASRYILKPELVLEKSEKKLPPLHPIFVVQKPRMSFAVRYSVACIISLQVFDPRAFDSSFWTTLASITDESKILNALHLMYVHGSGTAFDAGFDSEIFEHLIMDGFESNDVIRRPPLIVLEKCMEMCGIRTYGNDGDDRDHDRINRHFQEESCYESSESDASDSPDSIEEFLVEETMRALRVDDETSWNPNNVSMITPLLLGSTQAPSAPSTRPKRQEAMIRRVLVTPTRVLARSPEPDLLNRVLRQFLDHQDRFIRVSFCDEDGGDIAYVSSPDLLARIRLVLRDGILVAGDKFVFLAFSNSQLREHGTWMYNETPDPRTDLVPPPTADEIRQWMGDFSDIRVPGK